MIEERADFRFAMEPIKKNRIAFHLGMRNFYSDLPTGAEIGALENGSHAAASSDALNAVMIELFTGADWNPR
jgi:hypothetical protein